MVSWFGKLLLVATSLAPVCGAFAINRLESVQAGQQWYKDTQFWSWIVVAAALIAITCLFLFWCRRHLKHTQITTTSIKPTDKDVLAFLLAYLLPLVGAKTLAFDKPLIALYVVGLIALAVYHSNSFHFNPMLAIFGFHFYEIETDSGLAAMLISRRSHVLKERDIIVVRITDFLLLEQSNSEDASSSPD